MSPEREVSIGELAEDVRALAAQITRLIETIAITYVRKDVHDIETEQLKKQVKAIEERQTLIARTAVTALLLPVVALIVFALISGAAK